MSGARSLSRAVWRHRLFVAVLTTAFGIVAWYFATQTSKDATTSVLVRVEAAASVRTAAGEARAYAEVAETQTLLALIRDRLGDDATEGDDIRLEARTDDGAELVRITIETASRERSEAAAAALPDLLADLAAAEAFDEQMVAVETAQAGEARGTETVALTVFLAVLVGLAANSVLAILIERVSDRLPSPDELEASGGKPVLATVRGPARTVAAAAASRPELPSAAAAAERIDRVGGAERDLISAGAEDS